MFFLQINIISNLRERKMKIYPVNQSQKNTFKGRTFTTQKFKSNTKDFFEAASVVCVTSIPMFLYLLAFHFYEKYSKKNSKISKNLVG